MKRNKTNNKAPRSGKSPYAKYGKTPYKYSWQKKERKDEDKRRART